MARLEEALATFGADAQLLENEAPQQGDERQQILDALATGDLRTSPQEFQRSLRNSRHQEMLSDYSLADLSKMQLYKVPGFDCGFALKKMDNGALDIVSVHNNTGIKGIGEALMQAALKHGGCYLDHFDTPTLDSLYSRMGFVELSRDPYNADYDEGGKLKNKYGAVDVVYRVHKTCQAKGAPQ